MQLDLNKKIHELFGMNKYPEEQEVGIEIEVEGANVLHEGILSYWNIDKDGSLRGDQAEYKLKRPVARDEVLKVLLYLYKKFAENKMEIYDSKRTGVHVHVNVQTLSIKQLYQFITLYLCVEELMVRHAGEDRVGNLFCQRSSDAEGIIEYFIKALKDEDFGILYNDYLRYASLNPKAIQQFGSLEFRALKGGKVTPQEIATWVKLCLEIKDASLRFENPREIVEAVSAQGPQAFVRAIGPTVAHHLVDAFDGDVSHLVYVGVRQAQDIAYSNKWKDPVKKKEPEAPVEKEPLVIVDDAEAAVFDDRPWMRAPAPGLNWDEHFAQVMRQQQQQFHPARRRV